MIEFRVLGTLAIHPTAGDAPVVAITQPKRLALLLYLTLAEPSGLHSRESLMALLWPDSDAESARHSLRNTLYGLRQALGEAAFDSRGEGYLGLNPEAVRCDALEVRRLLSAERWEDALSAWQGDLAPGFHVTGASEFEQWLDGERVALRRAITGAAWHRVDQLEKDGDAGVVPAARRAWALDPADESGARRLLRLLAVKVGNAAALRAYHDLADHLRREFESEPSPETRALAEELKTRVETPMAAADRADRMDGADRADGADGVLAATAPVPWRTVLIVAALLIVGGIWLFALRPASARLGRGGPADSADPVAIAQSRDALRLPIEDRQDTSAFGSYVRGLTLRGNIASRDTFAALVQRKPMYSPGYAGLAHAYLFMVLNGEAPATEGYPLAEAAALRSIALDSTLATAYLALAMVELIWHWNVPHAGALIDRAIALDPKDTEAHAIRGNWFRWQGEADSSLAEVRKAFDLNPLDPMRTNRVAGGLVFAHRYAEAESTYRRALRDYPANEETYGELADLYQVTGRPLDALETQRTAARVSGDTAWLAQFPQVTSDSQAARVLADQKREELHDLLSRKRSGEKVYGGSLVQTYAYLRDTSATLFWLDSMVAEHDPMGQNVLVNPLYDFLRGDPRYKTWEQNLPWRVRR
jgi:DNA-binding SARP family transcriptional activator